MYKTCKLFLLCAVSFPILLTLNSSAFALSKSDLVNGQSRDPLQPVYSGVCDVNPNLPGCPPS